MTTLLELREKVIDIYSQYENYINLAVKFAATLLALIYINSLIGYQNTLAGMMPTFILALIGTLIPANLVVILLGVVILVHLYSLALEAAAIGALLFLVLLLVYFRFTPGDSMLLLLFPSCRAIGVQYALPIAGGLLYSPASGVTVAVGVIADSFLRFVHNNETAINSSSGSDSTDSMVTRLQFLLDGIMQDKTMMISVIAVAAAAIVVYVIHQLPIRNAWMAASGAGAVVQLLILLIGAMVYSTDTNIGLAFLGAIVGLGVGLVITFLLFNLDYSRVENTQFEDDDYYYYVRAIPKNSYARPRRTVKTINSRQGGARPGNRKTERRNGYEAERASERDRQDFYPEQQDQGWEDIGDGYYEDPGYDELPQDLYQDDFREDF
jgi:hypothetical protein